MTHRDSDTRHSDTLALAWDVTFFQPREMYVRGDISCEKASLACPSQRRCVFLLQQVVITDDDIRRQEAKVQEARRKLETLMGRR